MEFLRRPARQTRTLGILPGTFNPPTRAHIALAEAALEFVDEVLFVMPRALPHKTYEGVGQQDRLKMLESIVSSHPRFALASSDQGLFLDIARECREAYGPETVLWLICGRDAAERALNWNYGRPGAVAEMLSKLSFLVADRRGAFHASPEVERRVRSLSIAKEYDGISASQVRERIRNGEAWEHLVPAEIVPLVRELYAR